MMAKRKSLIVRSASVHPLRAELVSPFRIATGQHNFLENLLLRVELSNGIVGYGEAAVAQHITGETVAQTLATLQAVAAKIVGVDIFNPLVVCMEFRPYFKGNHAGLAAFEMAILDAFSRSERMPFWRLFGEKPERITTDVTIVIGDLEEARQSAEAFYRQGFRSFKIKIGRDEALDFRRVLAVKAAAPKAAIILDANQAFTAQRMLKFLKSLRTKGVQPALIEQPVPKDDWGGLKEVTRKSGTVVCADESVGSFAAAAYSIQTESVSAINIKFMKSGILESAEIARLAKGKRVRLMIGAMMESALAITAAAHFAAGLGGFDFIDLDTTFFIKGKLAHSPYLDGRGRFDMRKAGPGIGVEIPKG